MLVILQIQRSGRAQLSISAECLFQAFQHSLTDMSGVCCRIYPHCVSFQPEDSGSYTCIATNTAGEDTHTVTLTVHMLPAFTELPGDVALTKGEQLRLTCKATGIPVPRITWTFNNNIIPGGSLMAFWLQIFSPMQHCILGQGRRKLYWNKLLVMV